MSGKEKIMEHSEQENPFTQRIHITINFIFTSYEPSAQYSSLYVILSSLTVINPTKSLSEVFWSAYYLK